MKLFFYWYNRWIIMRNVANNCIIRWPVNNCMWTKNVEILLYIMIVLLDIPHSFFILIINRSPESLCKLAFQLQYICDWPWVEKKTNCKLFVTLQWIWMCNSDFFQNIYLSVYNSILFQVLLLPVHWWDWKQIQNVFELHHYFFLQHSDNRISFF